MLDVEVPQSGSLETRVNTRTLLAMLWVCHFILWIFGDMFSLLQGMGEPATETSIQFIAPTTAIVLTLLVVFTLVGRRTHARLANLIVAPVYLLLQHRLLRRRHTGLGVLPRGLLRAVQCADHLACLHLDCGVNNVLRSC